MAANNRSLDWASGALVVGFVAALAEISGATAAYLPRATTARGVLAAAAVVVGAVAARTAARHGSPARMIAWVLAASAGLGAAGVARFDAFASSAGTWVPAATALLSAILLGGAAGTAWKALLLPGLRVGTVAYWMHPFRFLTLLAAAGLWLGLVARLSLLQRATVTAGALGLVGLTLRYPLAWLHGRPPERDLLLGSAGALLVLLEGGWLFCTREVTPLGEVDSYPDPVVFAAGAERRYVVTSTATGFELFVDHQLAVSSLDGARYAEALARPALAAHDAPERVLLLGGGSGLVERALLDDPRVRALTVVTADRHLPELARRFPWLRALTRDALGDPRIRLVVAEPAVWLARATDPFDVVVAHLGAPLDYLTGKDYTTHFARGVAERLAPSGIAAFPAASAMQAPLAFAAAVATIRAADLEIRPYHIGVPTLGEWSFLLAAREEPPVPAPARTGPIFTPETLAAAFVATPDRTPAPSPPSLLHDQLTVSHFRSERGLDE